MAETQVLPCAADFLFGAPLYDLFKIEGGEAALKELLTESFKIDGYCPFCGRRTTYFPVKGQFDQRTLSFVAQGAPHVGNLIIQCARHDQHVITFNLRIRNKAIQKVGQFPSFADIANDESKQFLSVLSVEDAREFHKAIGLAAHGVGIGAYVYIRRIFERLIQSRFEEWKEREGWADEHFQKMRMGERIDLLKEHLPNFLVKNKKLYSILSLGIHELNEKDCLGFFSIIRLSTIFILEEDKRKKEELAQRDLVEKEISRYLSAETPDSKKATD